MYCIMYNVYNLSFNIYNIYSAYINTTFPKKKNAFIIKWNDTQYLHIVVPSNKLSSTESFNKINFWGSKYCLMGRKKNFHVVNKYD